MEKANLKAESKKAKSAKQKQKAEKLEVKKRKSTEQKVKKSLTPRRGGEGAGAKAAA